MTSAAETTVSTRVGTATTSRLIDPSGVRIGMPAAISEAATSNWVSRPTTRRTSTNDNAR